MDIKKRFTVVFSAVIVLMITACARDGFSQWVSDTTKNTPVCTASNAQQHPKACTDGRDGIIIVWEDFRNNHWDVYAQKLDYGGYAQWTSNGVQLCQNNNTKTQPVIATDGSGGAYVVWLEQRRGSGQLDLYGQHILSNGSLGYGTKGFAVDSVPNTPESATSPANAAICEDDNGNAFVVWEDNRTAITLSSRPDIYGNFLTSSGPAWGKSGAPVIAFTSRQNTPKIIPDGNGGAYLAWISGANVPQSIQVTRLNNSGYSTWGNNGVEVYAGANGTADISRNPSLTRDGNQLVISWETLNSSNSAKGYDVYANRFSSSGTPIWGSASSPVSISNNWNGDQTNSIIFTDDSVVSSTGNSGIMVVYQNDASKNAISMTRVIGDGSTDVPAYPNHIFTVCYENASDGSVANQTNPVAVKTGTGEILAAWVDGRLSTSSTTVSSIYAQRLDKTPRRYLGPNPSVSLWGVPVSNHSGSIADQLIMIPRSNGAIAVWRDNRNGTNNQDIYAQLIFRDGTLPIELSAFDLHATREGSVVIGWQTANENNNAGFEIERRMTSDPIASNNFEVVASYLNNPALRGAGSSNAAHNYSVVDNPGAAGTYEYRLVDYSLDGERTAHQPKTIEVGASTNSSFDVGQNIPNPFSESTLIPVTLASDAMVTIRISDILGRTVAMPYDNAPMSAGTHELRINANDLTNGSGSYYLTVTMTDLQTGTVIYSSPKAILMQVLR